MPGGGAEAEMMEYLVERLVGAGVELVEGAAVVIREEGVVSDWVDSGCAEWCLDTVEQLQEQDADTKALRGSDGRFGSWAL